MPAYHCLAPDDISPERFADAIFNCTMASYRSDVWSYMLGFYERRNDPNVLWVMQPVLHRGQPLDVVTAFPVHLMWSH